MTELIAQCAPADLDKLAEQLYQELNGHIILGIPIGIGKANAMVNALYRIAKANPAYKLDIHTALSLSVPVMKSELEARLLKPFLERQFEGLEPLDYASDSKSNRLPANVTVVEFYFKPGEMLKSPKAQQTALSANYTNVARDMLNRGINLITQMVSVRKDDNRTRYSLSSNPDITLDLVDMMRAASRVDGKKRIVLAQANHQLPFMVNDAEVSADYFDIILDDPTIHSAIFATPHAPISPADHLIGFYTSCLIKDGGTLQIGIGSLGDAIVNALLIRQKDNTRYQKLAALSEVNKRFPVVNGCGSLETFEEGLYGNTEMLVPGYLALKEGGVLKRHVYDNEHIQLLVNEGLATDTITLKWIDALIERRAILATLTSDDLHYLKHWGVVKEELQIQGDQLVIDDSLTPNNLHNPDTRIWLEQNALGIKLNHARLIHAGFFVGGHGFYDQLRNMSEDELSEINMTSVHFTNQQRGNEVMKEAQRKHARFINACMKMTLNGAAVSDGLADGKVVSGVGGQYNFVAMGHEIPEARSILMMRSHRNGRGGATSNIVFNYGYTTIPRHLRDIVITEYGIADLRAKTDQEVIEQLLCITDSRFQDSLIKQAIAAGKLPKDYQLPMFARNNTPEHITQLLSGEMAQDFPTFPFGTELTEQELKIAGGLKKLKAMLDRKWPLIPLLFKPISPQAIVKSKPELERMGLANPANFKEKLYRKLLLAVLN